MTRKERSKEPYRVLLATPLPRSKDRRVKLTDADKLDILARYKSGETIRSIARAYEDKCSRRTIQYVIRPELYEHLRTANRERRKDGRYKPDKAKHREVIKEHRHYKIKTLKNDNH